ncbi:MAG: hypothetical protein AABW67_03970 [Nanoarchaeota archaeon]
METLKKLPLDAKTIYLNGNLMAKECKTIYDFYAFERVLRDYVEDAPWLAGNKSFAINQARRNVVNNLFKENKKLRAYYKTALLELKAIDKEFEDSDDNFWISDEECAKNHDIDRGAIKTQLHRCRWWFKFNCEHISSMLGDSFENLSKNKYKAISNTCNNFIRY